MKQKVALHFLIKQPCLCLTLGISMPVIVASYWFSFWKNVILFLRGFIGLIQTVHEGSYYFEAKGFLKKKK